MSSVGAVAELGKLINLNVLHVYLDDHEEFHKYKKHDDHEEFHKYKKHEEMLLSSLCKLVTYKLQYLRITRGNLSLFHVLDSWSPLPSCLQKFQMICEYSLSKLPNWIASSLTSLSYLDIHLSQATEEDLRILGDLPALLFLRLCTNMVQKERLHVQGKGFRCLKKFDYYLFSGGEGTVVFEEGALPKVEKLELWFHVSMAKAYGFYIGIEHLPCLNGVHVTLWKDGTFSYSESKAAAAAIRKEVNLHPNSPKLTLLGEVVASDTDDGVNKEESNADEQS